MISRDYDSIGSCRSKRQAMPAADTTSFLCARRACIVERYFPVSSEEKVCVAGAPVLSGSTRRFVL